MIFYFVLLFITSILTTIFSWLPTVTTLPTINGINVDTSLVEAVGMFHAYVTSIWVLGDLFEGVIFYVSYLAIKMALRFFLGHRAPGSH
jgi:hypothetical protein